MCWTTTWMMREAKLTASYLQCTNRPAPSKFCALGRCQDQNPRCAIVSGKRVLVLSAWWAVRGYEMGSNAVAQYEGCDVAQGSYAQSTSFSENNDDRECAITVTNLAVIRVISITTILVLEGTCLLPWIGSDFLQGQLENLSLPRPEG